MTLIALFHTQSGAIKYHKALTALGLEAQLLPVPRKLSSSCGIAVKFYSDQSIGEMVSAEVDKLYAVNEAGYQLVYAGT